MQIDEYVREVLVQICSGVQEAMEQVRGCGSRINPTFGSVSSANKTTVQFDIGVETESSSKGGGKAKISVAGIGGQIGKELATTSTSSNRVQFSVGVLLPHDPT